MAPRVRLTRRKDNILTNTRLITRLTEYIDYVDLIRDEWNSTELWFRGVSSSGFKLIPKIYRKSVWEYSPKKADDICSEFARRAKPFVRNHHLYTRWQWYQLMQHYGLPTRLLDWTEGALVAMYFAIRKPEEVRVPSVWVMDPFWLNDTKKESTEGLCITDPCFQDESDRKNEERYLGNERDLPADPIAILPPHIDVRITAQKSVFTVHGKSRTGIENVCRRADDARLVQLRIASKVADELSTQLMLMGISEATLFPDLEGLSRQLMEFDMLLM